MDARTREAIERIKAGEKVEGLQRLHYIVDNEPDNVDAWYAIAHFSTDAATRQNALLTVLRLQPDHVRAKEMLAALNRNRGGRNTHLEKGASKKSSDGALLSYVSALALLILGIVIIYQQTRLNELTLLIDAHSNDIGMLAIDIQTIDADITQIGDVMNSHASDIRHLSTDQRNTVAVINSHASDINSLSRNLSQVSALAENANRYAHSHSYSDIALKTNLLPINNALNRVLSLSGVDFIWDNSAYPDLQLEPGRHYGVLAQDVAHVFPELVEIEAETGLLRVDYDGLIPVLIEAMREQQVQIEQLQSLISLTE